MQEPHQAGPLPVSWEVLQSDPVSFSLYAQQMLSSRSHTSSGLEHFLKEVQGFAAFPNSQLFGRIVIF